MSERHGILAAGNWIVDRVKTVDRWPEQDALANIVGQTLGNGGSPFNILVDLARLGADFPLQAVGLTGADEEGHWIRDVCRHHSIDTARLQATEELPTSYTDVMTVRDTGRRTFFHQRGANALLGVEHFDFSASRAKLFHLGYLLLLDRLDEVGPDGHTAATRVLAGAREQGMITSVDLVSEDSDRFASIVRAALPETDICFLNEFEAARTTGVILRSGGGLLANRLGEAAAGLLAAGVRTAVVLHFPEGACVFAPGGGEWRHGGVNLPPSLIRGAAGAGDAFAAGVLLAVHKDLGWEEALRYGVCAAAASLMHPTCSDGIAPLDECLALGATHGFRPAP
jgi:sugar/nucleoside kinase (ribokinase family)